MELPLTLLAAPLLSYFIGMACARFRWKWLRLGAALVLPALVIPWLYWAVFIAPASGPRYHEQVLWAPLVVVPAQVFGVLASVCAVLFSRARPYEWGTSSRS